MDETGISAFLGVIIGGLFVLTAVSVIIIGPILIFRDIFNYFYKEYINKYVQFIPIKNKYKKVLEDYSLYYYQLNDNEKKIFERRVQKFINMKEFVPRGNLERVTDEMKALIASTAIQITFGHPNVYFSHFWKILVYQDDYYSTISQQYHQGEVHTKGLIVLSWKSFVRGFMNRTDGRNLGLHEMAHALHLENAIQNDEYDFIDFDALLKFHAIANEEIPLIRSGESNFFREYAGTNVHEFFAVVVENFFERPREFYESHANIYQITCLVLNQNPLKLIG